MNYRPARALEESQAARIRMQADLTEQVRNLKTLLHRTNVQIEDAKVHIASRGHAMPVTVVYADDADLMTLDSIVRRDRTVIQTFDVTHLTLNAIKAYMREFGEDPPAVCGRKVICLCQLPGSEANEDTVVTVLNYLEARGASDLATLLLVPASMPKATADERASAIRHRVSHLRFITAPCERAGAEVDHPTFVSVFEALEDFVGGVDNYAC